LHRRGGEVTVLTTEEAKDAAETVQKLRGFVGLWVQEQSGYRSASALARTPRVPGATR